MEIYDQINKDVYRTRRENTEFFGQNIVDPNVTGADAFKLSDVCDVVSPKNGFDAMARILFVYAKLNPGIRYVQGMNELLAVVYFLFASCTITSRADAEADAFFSFSVIMAEQRDCFLKSLDHSESGMHGRIASLNSLLRALDFSVWKKLRDNGVDPTFYSLRWIMLLLSQELSLVDCLRLWDSLLHDPSPNALISKPNRVVGGGGRRGSQEGTVVGGPEGSTASGSAEPGTSVGNGDHPSSNIGDDKAFVQAIAGSSSPTTSKDSGATSSVVASGSAAPAARPPLFAPSPAAMPSTAAGVSDGGLAGSTVKRLDPVAGGRVVAVATVPEQVSGSAKKNSSAKAPDTFDLAGSDSDEGNSAADDEEAAYGLFDQRKYDPRGDQSAINPSASSSEQAVSSDRGGLLGREQNHGGSAGPENHGILEKSSSHSSTDYQQNNIFASARSSAVGGGSAAEGVDPTNVGETHTLRGSSVLVEQDHENGELEDLLPRVQQQPFLHYVCIYAVTK